MNYGLMSNEELYEITGGISVEEASKTIEVFRGSKNEAIIGLMTEAVSLGLVCTFLGVRYGQNRVILKDLLRTEASQIISAEIRESQKEITIKGKKVTKARKKGGKAVLTRSKGRRKSWTGGMIKKAKQALGVKGSGTTENEKDKLVQSYSDSDYSSGAEEVLNAEERQRIAAKKQKALTAKNEEGNFKERYLFEKTKYPTYLDRATNLWSIGIRKRESLTDREENVVIKAVKGNIMEERIKVKGTHLDRKYPNSMKVSAFIKSRYFDIDVKQKQVLVTKQNDGGNFKFRYNIGENSGVSYCNKFLLSNCVSRCIEVAGIIGMVGSIIGGVLIYDFLENKKEKSEI